MTIMKKELVIFCRLDTNSINLSADLKNMGAQILSYQMIFLS